MGDIDLSCELGGVKLKNPVAGASGTFGYGLLYEKFYDLSSIGGFVTKGLSLKPRAGNPAPRICETPSGMLNAIGLQNIGLERFAEKKLPRLKDSGTAVIVNFFGENAGEYEEMARRLNELDGVDGLEMNISCPNVEKGGSSFGTDLAATAEVTRRCRAATSKPLIVKLTPNVTDITEFARACEAEGADGLSVINTLLGMAIDVNARRPVLANISGGLSGPAIKPVALRMVWSCYKAVGIPIFGIGGITSAEDVAEFLMAGAAAVQIGSMNFVEPDVCARIAGKLPALLERLGAKSVKELTGAAHRA